MEVGLKQTRAVALSTGSKISNEEKATNEVTSRTQAMTLEDSSKSKTKKLDVLAEYSKEQRKQVASFVVIGTLVEVPKRATPSSLTILRSR